jgi:hypothetical protein
VGGRDGGGRANWWGKGGVVGGGQSGLGEGDVILRGREWLWEEGVVAGRVVVEGRVVVGGRSGCSREKGSTCSFQKTLTFSINH